MVVLEDSVFISRCDSETAHPVDVRINNKTGANFYKSDLPTNQIDNLKKLMKILGVNYCSADFIEDYNGNIFFLEMNICGAWWWMDNLHQGKILDAFVTQLTT